MAVSASSSLQLPGTGTYRYGWYATALLMLAYTLSFLDRQILNLMIGPIRLDLHITDHEFALIAGGAFGIFYTVMALPLGWLADRYSRKWIICAGIATWSVMTAACGLTRTFPQLFLTRVGVGVGEATLSPSTYSLLADYFDKRRLPRAMSVYTVGLFIGAGLALIIGGQVVAAIERWPPVVLPGFGPLHAWQVVFIMVGLPGLLLTLWLTTLREPERRGRTESVPFTELFRFIASKPRMFAAFYVGGGLYSVLGYADTWYPELFIRTWAWDAAQAGRINGISSLVAGPCGLLFAGWYSSRRMTQGHNDACLRLTIYGAIGVAAAAIAMPLMPTAWAMGALLFPFKFFVGFPPVLLTSAIQMVAPNRLRGQLGAVFLLSVGLIGVTGGPILPSLFTDYLFHSDAALRYSLSLAATIVLPLSVAFLWRGLPQYRAALEQSRSWT